MIHEEADLRRRVVERGVAMIHEEADLRRRVAEGIEREKKKDADNVRLRTELSTCRKSLGEARANLQALTRELVDSRQECLDFHDMYLAMSHAFLEVQAELQKAHECEAALREQLEESQGFSGFFAGVNLAGNEYPNLLAIEAHLLNQKASIHEQNKQRKEDRKTIRKLTRQVEAIRKAVL